MCFIPLTRLRDAKMPYKQENQSIFNGDTKFKQKTIKFQLQQAKKINVLRIFADFMLALSQAFPFQDLSLSSSLCFSFSLSRCGFITVTV